MFYKHLRNKTSVVIVLLLLLLALSHPLSKSCRVDIDFICIYEKNHDTESLSNIFHETVNMHIVEILGKLFKLSEITVSDFLN